jgi:ornithine cyclodeaminase
MLILDARTVRRVLPMPEAIEQMRSMFVSSADGAVYQPPRTVLQPPQTDGGFVFLKPAGIGGAQPSFGMKLITYFPQNSSRSLPTISGFVALFDTATGRTLALLDGASITEIRTGAVSAVATDALAGTDAGDLAIIGSGVQAQAHLVALAQVRSLRRVRVWSRNPLSAKQFVHWAADQGFGVEACDDVRRAVEGADLVCTVTASRQALLDGDWVAPGAHVNAVGSFEAGTRELHGNLVARARIVVDSRDEAAKSAGDLLLARQEGLTDKAGEYAELAEVLVGRLPGRTTSEEITVFESLGLAIEDIVAAAHVVRAAQAQGLGVEVSL